MSIIKPFKGLLYNKKLIKNIGDVIAPPYDVISIKEQNQYYRKHQWNIICLILGKEYKSDTKKKNRYTRAGKLFEKMQNEEILLQDEKPSFYYYTQEYSLPEGKKLERKGFLALLRIADFDEGKVLRHERILNKPFEDRVNLIRECLANFSPIFMLYSDKNGKIGRLFNTFVKGKVHFDFTDENDIRHRFWKIENKKLISEVERLFKRKVFVIADGHHRYCASMKFRDIMRKKTDKGVRENPSDYTMAYFTAMEEKELSILPIHRLVHGIENFNPEAILKKLSKYFDIDYLTFNKKDLEKKIFELKKLISKSKENIFSLYFRQDDRFYILKPIKEKVNERLIKSGISQNMINLDVVILHRLIFEKLLGITKTAQDRQQNIIYVKGNEDVASIIKRNDYQAAFLLKSISISDVYKIVKSGEVLPQKATFFYPKLTSGFVINKIERDKGTEAQKHKGIKK